MYKIDFGNGCSATINYRLYCQCKAEVKEADACRLAEADRELTFSALREAEATENWDLYSDIFKDLYGVRPR